VDFSDLLARSGASLSAVAVEPPSSSALRFRDCRRIPRSAPHLDALFRAYGFEGAVKEWLAAHPAAAAEELNVSLFLSMPGEFAGAWVEAPGERDLEFFPSYAAVSRAVQGALRRWIPYAYFSDPTRFDDVLAAWPLLVYQAMPPFRGQPKAEFTYDVMEVGATLLLRRSILRNLTATLDRVRRYLIALDKSKAANFFDPEEAFGILQGVTRQPRWLNGLLAADAFFVNSFVNLGLSGHAFRQTAGRYPARAARHLQRSARSFVICRHRRLRRLYAGRDFAPLGTLLLIEATRALCAARGQHAPLRAVLRLAAGDRETSFVNQA
jgi:hypothetical protein